MSCITVPALAPGLPESCSAGSSSQGLSCLHHVSLRRCPHYFVFQKAAALDPHDVAATPGPEGEAAQQRREEACYQHPMAVLRLLIDRTGGFSVILCQCRAGSGSLQQGRVLPTTAHAGDRSRVGRGTCREERPAASAERQSVPSRHLHPHPCSQPPPPACLPSLPVRSCHPRARVPRQEPERHGAGGVPAAAAGGGRRRARPLVPRLPLRHAGAVQVGRGRS